MAKEKLTDVEFWEEFWQTRNTGMPAKPPSMLQVQFGRWLPRNPEWTVIEIGAFPGTHLMALALSHGYRPVALDNLPAITELPRAAEQFGIRDLEVLQQDFLAWRTSRQFNVVLSLGFIEHFSNPNEVLAKQWKLVSTGGFLVMSVPLANFVQNEVRRLTFDRKELAEIDEGHNVKIMTYAGFDGICRAIPDARRVFFGPVGHMMLWHDANAPYIKRHRLFRLAQYASHVPKMLNWSSRLFSPAIMLIAQKQK